MAAAAPGPMECPVCHDGFTLPKLLPCTHLVCHKCVVAWIEKGGNQAGCPLCRKQILPGSHQGQDDIASQVDALPTDIATAVMVESEETLSGNHVCSCCEDAEGTVFCLQCAIKLCSSCASIHTKIPLTRDHVMEKLSNLSAEQLASHHQVTCASHSGKQAELYCTSHEELICMRCASSTHRKCSEVNGISDMAKEKREELKAEVKKLEDRETAIMEKISQLDMEVSDGQAKFKAMKDEVKAMFDDLLRSVEAKRQKLILDIRQREDAFLAERKSSKLGLEDLKGDFTAHRRTAERLISSATDSSLLAMVGKLKSRLAALESQVVPDELKIKTGSLALNSDIVKKIMEAITANGKLTDSSIFQKDKYADAKCLCCGEVDAKRGRTEEQEGHNVLATGSGSQGHPSPRCTPEKVKVRRSSSLLEDVLGKTSIVCKGIEANLNKKPTLLKHFSKFGHVKRVCPVPSKQYALIHFKTHEAASKAKKHGTILHGQDAPMTIFFKSSTTEKSPVASEDVAPQSRQPFRRPEAAESRLGKERGFQQPQLPPILPPSSVAAELASVCGVESDIGVNRKHSQDRVALGTGSARKVLNARRKKPAQQRISRDVPPPPASSSSTSTQPSSSTSSLGKTLNATVSDLRKMVATTTMEKVNVLDTRDKLLRQKIGKQTSGGVHSKAFVGTCPDMCPEKERLYREEVRRLSIYEIIPGSSTLTGSTSLVDHMRAVKEYSRSSADQDEPLPNELRPLHVLTLTMNYLLVEVADSGEDGTWAEWYDFLWNRTRSIREEITQQQLCSQEVVDLLEKCVRFHIYCSERLCTENMMVFDSKINDENLTKCLQTLKELYADMENKHGLYCPNEAEFRAYIVLMNLNEGDTLREVQQLRHEVRASTEIGFAVKAYSALYSNNYVRFFRLVRSATFLNACVLHRYFNQIRAQALHIILRSHTTGQKKIGFPLMELQHLLAFEKEEEIQVFCSYYGLQAVGGDLSLDRSAYVEPESSIPSWRAVGLVEFKCAKCVGEVINGGPLQPVSLPRPQCSFDEQGRFIGSLEGLVDGQEDQEKVKLFSVKAVAPQLRPSPLQETKPDGSAVPSASNVAIASRQAAVPGEAVNGNKPQQLKPSSEVLKTIARDLFFEVINQHAREVSESVISSQQMIQQCAADVMSDVTSSVVSDLARQIGAEVVEEERARHDQLLAAERRELELRGRRV